MSIDRKTKGFLYYLSGPDDISPSLVYGSRFIRRSRSVKGGSERRDLTFRADEAALASTLY